MGALGLRSNEKVKVYYNKVTLGNRETGHIVHLGCPSIELPWRQATEYAEKKMDSKEWTVYLIPALNSLKTTIEEEEEAEEEIRTIKCSCGNEEEEQGNDELLDQFLFAGKDEFYTYYLCNECMEEVKSKII
jgi:hypothetical protein